ncbi:MAG TPA: hypothetical protein ENJ31_01525 [Anaerolineae bacterium]|nr:hypothetical protein [Anaerolineae bacterium]
MSSARRPSPLSGVRPPAATEPAALMRRPSRALRDRTWERQNRAFSYRIPAELNDALHQIKREVEAGGDFRTTISLVAEAIIRAGLDAWDRGEVDVLGHEIAPTPGKRRKTG